MVFYKMTKIRDYYEDRFQILTIASLIGRSFSFLIRQSVSCLICLERFWFGVILKSVKFLVEEEKLLMEQIVSFVEDEDEGNGLSTKLFFFQTVYLFVSGYRYSKFLKFHQLGSHEKSIQISIHQRQQLQLNQKAQFQLQRIFPVRKTLVQNLEISSIWNTSKWRRQQAMNWLMLKIVPKQNQTGVHLKHPTRKRRNFLFQEKIEIFFICVACFIAAELIEQSDSNDLLIFCWYWKNLQVISGEFCNIFVVTSHQHRFNTCILVSLFLVLTYGPNNQLRGFRESIFIAEMLNRTIVVPPFFKFGLSIIETQWIILRINLWFKSIWETNLSMIEPTKQFKIMEILSIHGIE